MLINLRSSGCTYIQKVIYINVNASEMSLPDNHSKQVDASRCEAQALLKKHKEKGNIEDRRHSGRPRKNTSILSPFENGKVSSRVIGLEVAETSGTQLHPPTVCPEVWPEVASIDELQKALPLTWKQG